MITVDYFSSLFEVVSLTTKTADEAIRKLKAHLARHGIPDQLVSDNALPLASDKLSEFVSTYSFEHVTSSPTYAQSNGKVENAFKTAKSPLEKALRQVQTGPISSPFRLEKQSNRNPQLFTSSASVREKNQDSSTHL